MNLSMRATQSDTWVLYDWLNVTNHALKVYFFVY